VLDENLAADQQNRLRVVVETIGKPVTLETSTCLRYQCADIRDPGKNLIVEMIFLDGAHPTDTQSKQIERWICKVPIDGQDTLMADKFDFGCAVPFTCRLRHTARIRVRSSR